MVDLALETGAIKQQQEEFWMLTEYRHGVVCGKWDVEKEGGSDREGFRFFIIKDGVANTRPSKNHWQVYCTDDPATGLRKRLGIGPVEPEGGHVRKIYADLVDISAGLMAYRKDHSDFPYTHQGLMVLSPDESTSANTPETRQRRYMKAVPSDPWGRFYRYEYSELGGGVAIGYSLYTLGADNKRGGEGENADIFNAHLEFLEYVLNP